MKRVVRACLVLMLGILMTVSVWADSGMAQYPDYVTDYYMVVESPNGGIDFYTEASFDSTKLNTELIPNGTAFHIEGETTDANQRTWGYSKYHGMVGYISLDDCTMVSRSEAIKSELSIAETAAADYDYTTAGTKILYNGPGEKFGKVSGSIVIPEGTTVHIVKEAKLADGTFWGYTSYEYEGWISLESLVNIAEAAGNLVDMEETVAGDGTETASKVDETATEEPANSVDVNTGDAENNSAVNTDEAVNGETANDSTVNTADAAQTTGVDAETTESVSGEGNTTAVAEAAATSTPKPTATNTPTPKPTATNTPTPKPTATSTPTPEPTSTSTPTPEATSTNTPTPEATATNTATPEPTETTEPTVTMAPTATEEATATPEVTEAVQEEEASSANVEEANWLQSPIVWIGGICILLIIILLLYHFMKKNK